MKTAFLIPLSFLIFLNQNYAQNIELSGKLVDQETEAPISYATILMLDNSTVGAVSDTEGNFNFKYPSDIAEAKFFISTVGYADTTVIINSSILPEGVLNISLRSEVPTLDTVLVEGVKPQIFSTALKRKKYKIATDKNGSPEFFTANREGEMMGNHFEIGKAKIEKLNIYFYKHEKLADRCIVRLYSSNEEIEISRMKTYSNLSEIGNKQIVIDIDSTGYKSINLKDYGIINNAKYLIVLIMPYFPPETNLLKRFPVALIKNRQSVVNLVHATRGNVYAVIPKRVGAFLIEVDYLKLNVD
jgi:hypothetical protein